MSEYTLSQVSPTDKTTLAEIDALLQKRGHPPGRQSGLYLCHVR